MPPSPPPTPTDCASTAAESAPRVVTPPSFSTVTRPPEPPEPPEPPIARLAAPNPSDPVAAPPPSPPPPPIDWPRMPI
jgi:hypothetical protein